MTEHYGGSMEDQNAKIWTRKSAREVSDKKDSVGRWDRNHLCYILAKNMAWSAYGLKVLRETEFKSNGLFNWWGKPNITRHQWWNVCCLMPGL